ncbi:MAG: DEAD/DEAH box helicase [Clostridium sp.]|nr:DEAD/DEAH box helicase [Clostridium sp.]
MSNGADSVHKLLRTELENYIKSQYFGKSPLLLSAISDQLDQEGLLYQKPFIESSPAYKSITDGIQHADLPKWLKDYFSRLAEAGLGVYTSPFVHQIRALEAATAGKDLFIATGTGSGKTECFMWPLMSKLASEARNQKNSWQMRGVRTIIMYPMNALVSDQISRLRCLIGDQENKFLTIFRDTCGLDVRRPQFGMYTGRTPYPGDEPDKIQDHLLEKTLARMSLPQNETEKDYFNKLTKEGKVPAKADMSAFLKGIHNSRHTPSDEDAELITRFEMQQFCPDILITNYSMLEYMLLRPREGKIWSDTKNWLNAEKSNKLLFVIDEAHMYRGSAGGEVALLIRRLFHKLGIKRDQVQFILTTASMPDRNASDREAVIQFANRLTSANNTEFCYLTGEREEIQGKCRYDIAISKFEGIEAADFEGKEDVRLTALNQFWDNVEGAAAPFFELESAYIWMYDHLIEYRPFSELINKCRGNALSLWELATAIFPNLDEESALNAISILLAIAPMAKSLKGAVLFPARMHMLFRGIRGVYACTNEACGHSHSDGTMTLGEVFLSEDRLICPHCGSVVYELYNDRRCGALFYKGYILKDESNFRENAYLWHYPGQLVDRHMREVHLFIPTKNYNPPLKQCKNPIRPCYLDVSSGFLNFRDDTLADKPGIRKLYYCDYSVKGRPLIVTFPTCPHCRHRLSQAQLTSFSTRGNQSFFNLINTQFQVQPAVPGKDQNPDHMPNEGRKVLLFSDSRQCAAKLARDMSEASDLTAVRQLFVLAIESMEKSKEEQSMNVLYDYFCLAAYQHNVQIFYGPEREKFVGDCISAFNNYTHCLKRKKDYIPRFTISNAPIQMQAYLLRLFSGGYNTLYDCAISWIEPTDQALFYAVDMLEENGVEISEDAFLEVFNAWMISICDTATALGHTISDTVRYNVRTNYGGYGLDRDWKFPENIKNIMGWKDQSDVLKVWYRALKGSFLDSAQPDNGKLYVDLSRIRPRFDARHAWHKCERCSEITPYLLCGKCPSCGAVTVHEMSEAEYEALGFWRRPIEEALNGGRIRVIDTEEHTAQLSHKDQRDDMWSKTERYELRFQDLVQDDELPVDILSSTTTMEVGIDIGSLVAVGLRNIPPMRENYQQRAGRAGRRGSSLSTIVTFCEDGPHDTLYFNNPVPMFRGSPRKPWIDIESKKLLQRHLNMVILQEFLAEKSSSLDQISAASFVDDYLMEFYTFAAEYEIRDEDILVPANIAVDYEIFRTELQKELEMLKEKRDTHPELFDVGENEKTSVAKSLLDALYEEGIVPTYSFPKNVVSTYITDTTGKLIYEVDRGLDVAIGEYAPGRAIVVDKQTYQIGGIFYPGSERRRGQALTPARAYMEDPNYLKPILSCTECGWFGLEEEKTKVCPFCGNSVLERGRQLLRPWGFAPKNAEAIPESQLTEEYSAVQLPLYSTLPDSDEMTPIPSCQHTRIASRTNQRIIMLNKGVDNCGFIVCKDCGAAMPGDDIHVLDGIQRPYRSKFAQSKCRHLNAMNVNLGYDFVTDMLVLEIALNDEQIDTQRNNNPWLIRAAQSLAEAFRLAASKELDVEFTELVTGYRLRENYKGTFVDIYLYDSLSSGAGYAVSVADEIELLLDKVEELLRNCDCENACHNCLKHYRNHHVHGLLDRFAALELLDWGRKGILAQAISNEKQVVYVHTLTHILDMSGCKINILPDSITVCRQGKQKQIVVYPAMWVEPYSKDTIFISDSLIKYAKPYAIQKIIEGC